MSALPPRPRFDRDEYVSRRALHVEHVHDALDRLRPLHVRLDTAAMRLDDEIAEAQDAMDAASLPDLARLVIRTEAALDKLDTGTTLLEHRLLQGLQELLDRFPIRTADDRALFRRTRALLIEANKETL